jgi:hypothetical protein
MQDNWYKKQNEEMKRKKIEMRRYIMSTNYMQLSLDEKAQIYLDLDNEYRMHIEEGSVSYNAEMAKYRGSRLSEITMLQGYYGPQVMVSWLDILPHLPMMIITTDKDRVLITDATIHSKKDYRDGEEYIAFHADGENRDHVPYERIPNKMSCLAYDHVSILRADAERIGVYTNFETSDFYPQHDERPAARKSIQPIIYQQDHVILKHT